MTARRHPEPREGSACPGIEFVGAFEDSERAFLSEQFSRCRFELIRRAARDRSICLLTWQAAQPHSSGPAPLRTMPNDAVYVLRGKTLTRVETPADVERELGEPVGGDLQLRGLRKPNLLLDGAKEALRGLIPWR